MSLAGSTCGKRSAGGTGPLVWCILFLGLLLSGCQAPGPRATTQPAVPTEGNGALAEYIADQPYVTVEPAYRAVYILWKNEVFDGDFAALTDALEAGSVIPGGWDYPADALISRGSVGYLLCRACGIRSGLNWRLTGLGRYAWRELNYLGIASPLSEYGYVPGGQFIGMLARAEEYMHRYEKGDVTRVELGPKP
ncbi:MAG: hypothetical protein PVJ57_14235 [Phycisphaerae bacterium]|jgi:hypothetical protein